MERKYIIPLRKEWLKVPIYQRSRKATKAARAFLQKHMKVENVKLGKFLNLKLWSNGNRNPPHKIEVVAKKFDDKEKGTYVIAEIPGKPLETKKEPKKKKAKGITSKLKEKLAEPEKEEKKPVDEMSKEDIAKEEEKLAKEEQKEASKRKVAKPKKEERKTSEKDKVKDQKKVMNKSDMKREKDNKK